MTHSAPNTAPLQIGPIKLTNGIGLAPMAGVTDRPFRQLCRRLGAGFAVSEMLTADKRLWHSRKSRLRMDHSGEPGPIIVQIAGSEPAQLAEAAIINAGLGADIIDINMGCPQKKVCRKAAGSALMSDPKLVQAILEAVVTSVSIPVTLKIRTGPDPQNRNAEEIASIAEQSGVQALAIHGRTRADKFLGNAEYDTIARVKQSVSIPVIANGDIDSAEKAQKVLDRTGADGIMIGRAAQGHPWIFREVVQFLQTGTKPVSPSVQEQYETLMWHLEELHRFYGEFMGVRIARKHLGWYVANLPGGLEFSRQFNNLETAGDQQAFATQFFTDRGAVSNAA